MKLETMQMPMLQASGTFLVFSCQYHLTLVIEAVA